MNFPNDDKTAIESLKRKIRSIITNPDTLSVTRLNEIWELVERMTDRGCWCCSISENENEGKFKKYKNVKVYFCSHCVKRGHEPF